MPEKMTKESFLQLSVFSGLKNRNDGFDAENIHYFNESDFLTVLQRAETLGIALYGIEPWKNKGFYGVKLHEDYDLQPTDPKWYNTAFSEFKKEDDGLLYAASYGVPENLLKNNA